MLPLLKRLGILLVIAAIYVVAGKLGLRLAFVNASATAVWPPVGIALAALLIVGRRAWPAILVGAFVVNYTTSGGVGTSLGIAVGNTAEAVIGAYLLERYASGRHSLARARDVFAFAFLAAGISTAVGATIGVATLSLGHLALWSDFGRIWLTWWLGDAGGVMIVAPVLLLWSANPRVRWRSRVAVEGAVVLATAIAVSQMVFGGLIGPSRGLPLTFAAMPLCIWAAFRLGRRMSSLVVAVVYLLAVRGTVAGFGPFAQPSANESLLLLQVFAIVLSLTALLLAAVVAEQRESKKQLRQLSVTDGLTGLANYRHLLAALERDVQRSQRTNNPFALLFLDVNGLKAINDRFGHLVGSRALCRVADVLRRTSRAVDTPARYGGDEFALVLPYTDEAAAARVGARIDELLALDREPPAVTVSRGVALYPRDGSTPGELLAAADRLLYGSKTRLKETAQSMVGGGAESTRPQ